MPRIARVVLPDVPYHITQRGNYRQDVFEDQQDKESGQNHTFIFITFLR
jgi:REP element-mobilizing transposase RayT